MKVIYPLPNGSIAVIHPTGELAIGQVAIKDVPAGVPYKIIDDSDIPEDRSLRDAWTADFSAPDGHGIGPEAWMKQKEAEHDQN